MRFLSTYIQVKYPVFANLTFKKPKGQLLNKIVRMRSVFVKVVARLREKEFKVEELR